MYDKRDDFNFEKVNFTFIPSCGVYIYQHILFARVCPSVNDFNNRKQLLTAKLLQQGY